MKTIGSTGRRLKTACFLFFLGLSMTAWAQDDLGVTMRMVAPDEPLTESVVQEIQLPEPPAGSGRGARRGVADRDVDQSVAGGIREARGMKDNSRPVGPGDLPDKPDNLGEEQGPQRPEAGQAPGGR